MCGFTPHNRPFRPPELPPEITNLLIHGPRGTPVCYSRPGSGPTVLPVCPGSVLSVSEKDRKSDTLNLYRRETGVRLQPRTMCPTRGHSSTGRGTRVVGRTSDTRPTETLSSPCPECRESPVPRSVRGHQGRSSSSPSPLRGASRGGDDQGWPDVPGLTDVTPTRGTFGHTRKGDPESRGRAPRPLEREGLG